MKLGSAGTLAWRLLSRVGYRNTAIKAMEEAVEHGGDGSTCRPTVCPSPPRSVGSEHGAGALVASHHDPQQFHVLFAGSVDGGLSDGLGEMTFSGAEEGAFKEREPLIRRTIING